MSAADRHGTDEVDREAQTERRRRREQVFGDVLPECTRDEQPDGAVSGDVTGDATDAAAEEWLRRQRPPHHG